MSSIPPKSGGQRPLMPSDATKPSPALDMLQVALADKDEGRINVFLNAVVSKAHQHPDDLRQVFNVLHQTLTDSARHGTPMLHKEKVSAFLAQQGQQRLERLVQDVMHPPKPQDWQKNVAEARGLLDAGYGGRQAATMRKKIELRSFGRAPAGELDGHGAAGSKPHKGGAKHALQGALSAARKGVSVVGQRTGEKVVETLRKGRRGPQGGDGTSS